MGLKRLLIDSDPATGHPNRDVDDGLAILFLLASPEIQVEGITINFGNVGARKGFTVARNLLDLIHSDVPVHLGAGSSNEMGKGNAAVDFLIEKVRSNPGEISLLCLGPLTNVATAMLVDPNFASDLKELVIMGGALHFKPFSCFGEFNFHSDGRAASIVMSAPIPKTLITMDVCSLAVFRREHLQMIEDRAGPLAQYLTAAIRPWLELNRIVFFRAQGFFPWDVVAAAYLIDGTLFDANSCSLAVQERGICSGRIMDFKFAAADPATINVPTTLDAKRFMKLFMDGLLNY